MSADPLFPVPPAVAQHAHVDEARYQALYQASISDPDRFWAEQARRIDWMTAFTQVKQTSFDTGQLDIQWFAGPHERGGKLMYQPGLVPGFVTPDLRCTATIRSAGTRN